MLNIRSLSQKGNSLLCPCVCSLPSHPFLEMTAGEKGGEASLESQCPSSSGSPNAKRDQQQLHWPPGIFHPLYTKSPSFYSLNLSISSSAGFTTQRKHSKSSNKLSSLPEIQTRLSLPERKVCLLCQSQGTVLSHSKRVRGIFSHPSCHYL